MKQFEIKNKNEFRVCKFENCKFKTYDRLEMIHHINDNHFYDDKIKKVK
mgnify:CR=1 FL=1